MRKRNSFEMIICFYSIVLMSAFGLTFSDLIDENFHRIHKNIFLDPVKPQLERCRTSLGEHGRCMPLNDCPPLRDYAEGRDKDRLVSVIKDFGCGFQKVVFVCCTVRNLLIPLEGSDLSMPHEGSHVHHHGENHQHHSPESFQPGNFHGFKEPVLESGGFAGFGEEERPDQKGSNGDDSVPSDDQFNEKPVYEVAEGVDNANQGRRPKENEESKKDKATTPLWESSDFVVSQEDSWVWPSARKNFEKFTESRTTPDWIGAQQTNTPLGGNFGSLGQSSHHYNVKPNQFGSSGFETSGFGSGQPIGSTGTFSNGGLLGGQSTTFGSGQPIGSTGTFSNGGLLGGQSTTFGSSSQGIGIGSSGTQGTYDNQGFGSGIGGSSNLGNQGFGSSYSSGQGFTSGRPSQSGLNSQSPQTFGSYDNQGMGSIDRPISQGFGNERPSTGFSGPNNYETQYNRPSSGLNGPSNYNMQTSRPGTGRPGSHGSQRPTNYQEESFGLGGLLSGGSNQRPNNHGSNKKPNRGGSNKRRLLPDGKCGTEISDKIIGGDNTKLDEFPWMALLHFTSKNGQDRGYGCGGSLINERYVLTAAHCIKGPSLPDNVVVKDVRLGEYDLTKERDCVNDVCSPSPLDVAVEEIIAHPDYKPNDKAQHHDIALIRLRRKVPFTTYVSPICLPGDELKKKDYTGKQMVVAGWGKTANGANAKSSAIKQKVTLPFVTLEECKPFYEGINIRLRNTQLCAGGERAKDSCQGDSGGPLMTNEVTNGQSSWFATGIVSFGPEDCGIQNIAGVYTRVSEYVDWILDNMKE